MPDNTELVAQLRARLEQIHERQRHNDELLKRLAAARGELAALAATATSPDGAVTVVAGAGGVVRSVELAESAMRTDARTLSATITATVQQAVGTATARQLDIVRTRVGPEVDPARILGAQAVYAEPAPAPARVRDEDDEDDQPDSFMVRR